MDDLAKFQAKQIQAFEVSLGLPAGFVDALELNDDWSFVIKIHALLEAAMTQFLVYQLEKPSIEEWVAKQFMSRKLELARALGVVFPSTATFIEALGQIRNHAVHRVSGISLNLERYFRGLPPKDLDRYQRSLDLVFSRDNTTSGTVLLNGAFVNEIWPPCDIEIWPPLG